MYEVVEVVKNNNNKEVEVTCPAEICSGCSGSMFCNVKGKTFNAKVPKDFEQINVGDKLKLYLPPAKTISSSFITLIVPLLLFPIFYLLSPFKGEGGNFLFGLLGIVIGFIAVAIYFKINKNKYYPKVVEKINE